MIFSTLWYAIFDRSLVEAVQGIAFSSRDDRLPFAQIWAIFAISSCIRFKTSLDMFKNHIKLHHEDVQWFKTSLDMIVKSYQIVSEYFKVFKTSLDMFVKIVFWVLGALLAFRALLELKALGALASGLGLNAFESCLVRTLHSFLKCIFLSVKT